MKRIMTGAILTAAVAVWAANTVQPLNVKLGLWEVTTKMTTKGAPPIPAGMLNKLTPEQRARVEAAMKAKSGERTQTYTHKNCLTREKLEHGDFSNQKECTQKVITSTSSKMELDVTCSFDEVSAHGKISIEALNSENTRGEGTMTASGNGQNSATNSSFTARWLGAKCEE